MIDAGWLDGAAFLAGLVDPVVGGGGLIQVSAISSFLLKEAPATPGAADVVCSLVAVIVLLCFTWNKAGALRAVRLFYVESEPDGSIVPRETPERRWPAVFHVKQNRRRFLIVLSLET